ncbi:MAG: cell division protein FtsA [Patescibacteria group bacterium]
MQNYILGLDIGSQSVKGIVAERKKNGQLALIKILKMPSAGIRRGIVDDLAEATRSVNQLLAEVKQVSKGALKNIYLSVGSADFRSQPSKGIVAVSRADSEIHHDDVDRAIEASQALKLPPNRMIVHSVTKEFIVDDIDGVTDPLGMIGNRLEVNSLIIDAFSPVIKNLTRCVESAGGSVSSLIFSPLAASRSILSKTQKDLGVALIDIGFGKTSLCVYEENKIIHTAVFPIGSGSATNDLAIGLKTSIPVADSIKLTLGSAMAKEVPAREMIDMRKFDAAAKNTISRRFIAEILEVRLAEILEFVNNELKRVGKSSRLPAGAVLVGGGAKMPGIVDLAKQELRLGAQIGIPNAAEFEINSSELMGQAEDPDLACAFGLALWGGDRENSEAAPGFFLTEFIKKIFKSFIP